MNELDCFIVVAVAVLLCLLLFAYYSGKQENLLAYSAGASMRFAQIPTATDQGGSAYWMNKN